MLLSGDEQAESAVRLLVCGGVVEGEGRCAGGVGHCKTVIKMQTEECEGGL